MYNNEVMLSMEDFLAISTDYQKEKEAIRKKYRNYMIIGLFILGFSIIVLPLIMGVIMASSFDGYKFLPLFFIIALSLIVVGAVIAGINSNAMKKKPKELGIRYYQKYVSDFNAKHHK